MSEQLRKMAPPIVGVSSTAIKMAELAVAQGALFAFPLLFAIVCAGNLGPANYGVVAFYTALTAFMCTFVEFGFDSIGVREVHVIGRHEDPSRVVWNVTLAKLLVCLVITVATVSVLLMTRSRAETSIIYASAFYMIAFALDMGWYLRSLELMRSVLVVTVVSRLAGIVLLVLVVKGPEDVSEAMWSYAFMAWANAAAGWSLMRMSHVIGKPSLDLPHLRSLFRSGSKIVIGNISGDSLTSGGVALLGAVADPALTGAANIALRLRNAGQATMLPIIQIGFVRLSALVATDRKAGIALGRKLFYALMTLSTAVAILIIVNADRLAALVYRLPHAPQEAVVLVRLLAAGIPVSIAGALFGLQCLTLFRQERAYVAIQLSASALFFALLFFTNAGRSVGYGWALLAADTWIMLASGLFLHRVVRAEMRSSRPGVGP